MLKFPMTRDKDEVEELQDLARKLMQKKLVRDEYHAQLQAHLLHAAVYLHPSWIPKLVAAGADVNFVYLEKETALSLAADFGRVEWVELLLKHGADPEVPRGKDSALNVALYRSQDKVMLPLLRALPPASRTTSLLNTFFHKAVARNNVDLVQWLLENGAQVNSTTPIYIFKQNTYATALMHAAFNGSMPMCQALLQGGADINKKDKQGNTALDYARESHRQKLGTKKMIAILEANGALPGSAIAGKVAQTPQDKLAAAATQPGFQEVLKDLQARTKKKPQALEGHENEIPGGFGFQVAEKLARQMVEELQESFLKRGAFIFHGEDLLNRAGSVLGVIASADPLQAVAAIETEGPNENVYNKDLIKWLKAVMAEENLRVTGLCFDTLEAALNGPPRDPVRLAKRLQKICQEMDTDTERLARKLETEKRFVLWWD